MQDSADDHNAADASQHDNEEDQGRERDATELRPIQSRTLRHESTIDSPSLWSIPRPIKVFWGRHVRLSVPHEKARDFLALERTYLAYIRTSMAISMIGIFIAQLFRLHHSTNPNPIIGYFVVSVPLASLCQIVAAGIAFVGGYRYWRQQNAMARGKVHAGGWEITVIGVSIFLLTLTLFAILLAVDITKEDI